MKFWPKRKSVTEKIKYRDRFGVKDLLNEAAHGIGAKPGRLVLTTLGTVLGIASVVATVGLATTAAGQIGSHFDEVSATQAVAKPKTERNKEGNDTPVTNLTWSSAKSVTYLNGVSDATLIGKVNIGTNEVTAVPVKDPSAAKTAVPKVFAVSGDLPNALQGEVTTGRFFDEGHSERGDKVAVIGENLAKSLSLTRLDSAPNIFIGEENFTVIGIVSDVKRRADVLGSVMLPVGTAEKYFGTVIPDEMHLHIAVGAGPVVKDQVPWAIDPNYPSNFSVTVPASAADLRKNVEADVNAIFLALGAVALLVGGLGIANVTLLSVMERRGEIGLRRALGATKRNIAGQFIVESVVVGLLGGLIGAAIGVFAVVGVSVIKDWTAIVDIKIAFGTALLGGVIGLIAGTYPALKAASIEPIAALRGGI